MTLERTALGDEFVLRRTIKKAVDMTAGGNTTLFNVDGLVAMAVMGIPTTNVSTTAPEPHISVGNAGSAAGLLPDMHAVLLQTNVSWVDAVPAAAESTALPVNLTVVTRSAPIILTRTLGGGTIDTGVVDFVCMWAPLSAGAEVRAA